MAHFSGPNAKMSTASMLGAYAMPRIEEISESGGPPTRARNTNTNLPQERKTTSSLTQEET